MGLTVAAFTPNCITIGTDSLSEVRNKESFFYTEIEKLFVINSRYVVAIEGCNFHNGLPVSYYMRTESILNWEGNSVKKLAEFLSDEFKRIFQNENIIAYVAGYDKDSTKTDPYIYMIHNDQVVPINIAQDGVHVYNFHAVGRSHWINKLMMRTEADINGDKIEFESADIDFSKYSPELTKRFVRSMLTLSEEMYMFSQKSPQIGGKYQIATIHPTSGISIESF